eukprot:357961-Chlamydomonas_euryale.AAC.4
MSVKVGVHGPGVHGHAWVATTGEGAAYAEGALDNLHAFPHTCTSLSPLRNTVLHSVPLCPAQPGPSATCRRAVGLQLACLFLAERCYLISGVGACKFIGHQALGHQASGAR